MANYYLSPISLLVQLFNNIGVPLQGGFVQTLVAGSVSTQATTYTDSTGTTPNANPIALSSAGRLVAAGTGAPVAVWVAAGVAHKMVITDAAGNFILSLDNLTGINDITGAFATLAMPASGSGVDLVANAVKSYLNFAAMRAAPVPSLVSGQTLIVIAAGAVTEADNRGGAFIWDSTLSGADNGFSLIAPSTLRPTQTGRYIRISEPYVPNFDSLNPVNQGGVTNGSFNGLLTGLTTSVSVACVYYLLGLTGAGALVVLIIGAASGVSNSTTLTMTGLPAAITPVNQTVNALAVVEDNGSLFAGAVNVTSTSNIVTFGKNPGVLGGFTNTGTKGTTPTVLIYPQS